MVIKFRVLGTPAPKGSSRAMMAGGKAVHVPGGSKVNQGKLRSWDSAVREAAASAVGIVETPPFVDVALRLTIVFALARPSGHWTKPTKRNPVPRISPSAPAWPRVKPDWDKLSRSTCDSLKGIVYDDDSRIVEAMVRKRWALPGEEGAFIKIERMPDEQED